MKNSRERIRQQFRWVVSTLLITLLLLLCIFMVTGCSDDDSRLPSYHQELCEILTDSKGNATVLRSDDGKEHVITNPLTKLVPDSLYRVLAFITEEKDGVMLRSVSPIASPLPFRYAPSQLHTDPVEVITVWKVDRYLNLRLAVNRSNETPHTIGFADKGIKKNENGTRTQLLQLHYDSHSDGQYFRYETNISCPLYPLAPVLRKDIDSVRITINTNEGPFVMTTLY